MLHILSLEVKKLQNLQVVMDIVIVCKIVSFTVVLNKVTESNRFAVILFADF